MALGKNLKKRPQEGDNPAPKKATDHKSQSNSKKAQTSHSDGAVVTTAVEKKLRTKRVRKRKTNTKAKEKKMSLVVFPVGKEEYAIPIAQVKEIVKLPPITKIPKASSHVRGLVNVRGEVYSVWDLVKLFNLEEVQNEQQGSEYSLVIQLDGYFVTLTTPIMPSTLIVDASSLSGATHILKHSDQHDKYISGVVRKDDRLIILIDVFELLKSVD